MSVTFPIKNLLAAERKILAECKDGERVLISDSLPTEASVDVEVRGEFIRALLLDQIDRTKLNEKGVRLKGARIIGVLDLQGCVCGHDVMLSQCLFDRAPSFLNARMRGLVLNGCILPGMTADNAQFDGSVYLRSGFESSEEISMPGARILGDFQICDARLSGKGRASLFAASLRVDGSVFLGDYPYDDVESDLRSDGSVIFLSAKIAQDFYARNCAISPQKQMFERAITLDGEDSSAPSALSLARADVGGVLHMVQNQISGGSVNLSGAVARRLHDEPNGEGAGFRIRLDGFDYREFSQGADTSLKARLEWLERRPAGIDFSAQPYEHLARVLTKIGHGDDARQVLMRKERMKRAANIDVVRAAGGNWLRVFILTVTDRSFRYLVGYGYRPVVAGLWGLLLIFCLSLIFHKAWKVGDMAPNAAPILVSKDWIAATVSHPDNPAAFWAAPGQAGQDYETFHAGAYAADLLIPIVNLGQEDAWAPSTSRSPWGKLGWWIRWFAKVIGWVITALGAAAITGVIRRD